MGEVGDVLLGRIPGRISHDDVTLFESLGIASEDLASAHHIYEQSKATGIGAELELSGVGNEPA